MEENNYNFDEKVLTDNRVPPEAFLWRAVIVECIDSYRRSKKPTIFSQSDTRKIFIMDLDVLCAFSYINRRYLRRLCYYSIERSFSRSTIKEILGVK